MDALDALLGAEKNVEKDVYIKRLDVHFKIKALDGQTINKLRDAATHYVGKGAKRRAEFNDEEFKASIISAACVNLDFGNRKLLDKYGAKDANDCVYKALLAGEVMLLHEEVLRLSGFDEDDDEELEEVKN
ncbi:phage tail assembly chaperone [Cytobacillus firmus]|uniref:phage tail assembly chaperone n=1 Tax=Cytobacillus firmus TaxID=1399 RepID=UPI0018CD4B87|nr:hypothetical protein [Cytobacillus firmus]MED1906114.1 hypothetical protein [Cytobacillus firmus]MED1941529.1 hypothetical protein [Cytobacillus firmus]